MIKAVNVTNYLGDTIRLELRDPESSGFIVKEITGLGPSKADINTTEVSSNDGSIYNSARMSSRNIIFTLLPMDMPSVETNRQKSYKYFPIKKKLRLAFETENREAEIYGYVESNEPDIFSKQETQTISIICPNPYFYSAGEDGTNYTVFYGVEPIFEFPFENNSVNTPMLEFGDVSNQTEKSIYYNGDAEIGVQITIHAIGLATNITIYNTGTREKMLIDTARLEELTGQGITSGDDIIINTTKGKKSIQLLRNGQYTNILNCLTKDTDWFQLAKGDNVFAYVAEEGIQNLQFKIENQTVYEGI
jgi:hypothetical protein